MRLEGLRRKIHAHLCLRIEMSGVDLCIHAYLRGRLWVCVGKQGMREKETVFVMRMGVSSSLSEGRCACVSLPGDRWQSA